MNGGPGAFSNVPESPADAAGKACVPVFLGEIPVKERHKEIWRSVLFSESRYLIFN